MQRIDGSTAALALPAPGAVSGTPGYFTSGDPQVPTPPTQVTADWLNMIQEELVYVIVQAGIGLSKNDHTQLAQAIVALIETTIQFASDAEATGGILTTKAVTPHSANALVTARINALVNGAPLALDTLKELADAINDDQNFAATVTAALAARALASRVLNTSGLAIGGGDLTADRTISVPKAAASDILAGTDDGKAVTPAGLTANSGGNWQRGWRTLPGGDIEQWGTETVTGSGSSVQSFTINFPTAFANPNCIIVGNSTPFSTATGAGSYHPLVVMFEPAAVGTCKGWLDAIQTGEAFSDSHTVSWIARGR